VKSLPFAGKMLLIGGIFIIPIVLLLVVLFFQMKGDVDFASQERLGVAYTEALRPLLYDFEADRMQPGRGAVLAGRIAADFERAQIENEHQGAPLRLSAELASLDGKWQARASADVLLHDTLALLVSISDNSKITLDPTFYGYYVGDTMVDKVPNLIDAIAQSELAGTRVLRTHRISPADRIALTELSGRISALVARIARNLPIAVTAAPYLAPLLDGPSEADNRSTAAYMATVSQTILQPARIHAGAEYEQAARAARAAAFTLYDASITAMDGVLGHRINTLVNRAELIFGIVIALILGAVAIMVATTRSIARRLGAVTSAIGTIVNEDVTQLVDIANAIARGDAHGGALIRRPPLVDDGTDEAAVLARSYNSLADRLADVNTDFVKMTTLLSSMAFHDALTGLANRALFMDRIEQTIARIGRRSDRVAAVLFLDLDRFKLVNDSMGHAAGDLLLIAVARRLEQCLRAGDTVARLGGDEFTILLEDIHGERDAIVFAERILAALAPAFSIASREMFASGSIGIAITQSGYNSAEDILRDADIAMYRAKHLGKNRCAVFAPEFLERASGLLQLETDLIAALERHEFVLYYQPIVELATNELCGFEALIRWQHPQRGLVMPDAFISAAEESGAIIAIGAQVPEEAGRQARLWRDTFPLRRRLGISVNVSARQFSNPRLIDEIKQTLRKYDLDVHDLHIEITESAIMGNPEVAAATLGELRDMGMEVHLDDFGTGYSSLAYLHRFPVHNIKIDRSFIGMSGDRVSNPEIVKAVASLAESLSMTTTAEGIETPEQLAQLQQLNCTKGQGYYFSRPVSATIATEMIAKWQPASVRNTVLSR
jgi:diguanylate cyclase (GGDEF)-like protein